MIEPGAYLPTWAEAIGLSPPREGETFREHARRLLLSDKTIDRMLEGLDERTAPIAHARLGSYLYRREARAGRTGAERITKMALVARASLQQSRRAV